MDDVDRDAWRAVDQGERELDWSVWLGQPDCADYLTPTGRELLPRMVSDLTAFFGSGWLHRAAHPDPETGRQLIPGLGRFAPTLALSDQLRPGTFVEAVRWWAGLQFLEMNRAAGIRTVRNDVRRDVRADRLFHTLTQSRLAAIGASLGAKVTLEPAKAGGPGDVLLNVGGAEIFIEVVTFNPEQSLIQQDKHTHRHMLHLHLLEGRYAVHFEGSVSSILPKAAEERWQREVEEAAARCAQTGQLIEMHTGDGGKLIVRPGSAPKGTELTGPLMESDQSRRLIDKMRNKGAKTRGAGLAWIWVEDHGGLHPTTDFLQLPLAEQLVAMKAITNEVLSDYGHVAGIIYSYAHRRRSPLPPDEYIDGYALQRGLPVDRVRRTFINTRRIILPTPTNFLIKMCDQEPRWLDRVLGHLGIPGGVQALLVSPDKTPPSRSRLWTPI